MDARVTALEAARDHVMIHVPVVAKDAGTVAPISKWKAPTTLFLGAFFLFRFIRILDL